MIEAVEITSFKLIGCSCEEFINANAEVDVWLRRQPGFRSRRIAKQDDGTIVDVLIWDSVNNAVDSANRLMVELADSEIHAMIDQRTVSWSACPVRHIQRMEAIR